MSALLEVRGLSKRFGGLLALSQVNFSLAEGEILGLIGPNGAGKTTLFNLLNGAFKPDQGSVVLAGENVTGWPPNQMVRQGLARTHQIVKPLSNLTVLENVTVGACFGRDHLPLKDARKVAREVLEFVGLADRLTLPARSLTIAGKKRLEVARALAAHPRLILLDEVLSGLNPSEVAPMVDLVRLLPERGIAVFIIEHLMQAIMGLSHRIIVLNFGEKIAEGCPEEIAHHPQVIEAYLGDPHIAVRLMESA